LNQSLPHTIQPFGASLRIHAEQGHGALYCILTVLVKNSSGFITTNFSVKHRPFLYLHTFVLAIKPLLFLYIVVHWLFLSANLLALAKTYSFAIFGFSLGWCELQMCMALS